MIMVFKSDKQRKAVMAKLAQARISTKQASKMTFTQLKKNKIFLKPTGDADKDNVKNKFDCRPLNKNQQGKIHQAIRDVKNDKNIKKLTPSQRKTINKALKDSEKIKTHKDLGDWIDKYGDVMNVAVSVGVTAAAIFISPLILLGFMGIVGVAGISIARKLEKQFEEEQKRKAELQRKRRAKKPKRFIIEAKK